MEYLFYAEGPMKVLFPRVKELSMKSIFKCGKTHTLSCNGPFMAGSTHSEKLQAFEPLAWYYCDKFHFAEKCDFGGR
jgi:hypothetical protein